MKIKNFQISSTDYPGKLSVILFSQGCNYKCPSCYNKQFLTEGKNIDEEYFFLYLDSKKRWIDGVVLCGGEPTLQDDLCDFVEKIKEKGLAVKLDTNGSNPEVLYKLREGRLIDYVAMDVKGPENLYSNLIGKKFDVNKIKDSIIEVSQFPNYEFRTTVVPVIRENGEISFMDPEEIGETAKLIYDCTGRNEHKYFLQKFVPQKDGLINSRLEKFSETLTGILEKGKEEAIKYLPNTKIR